MRMRDQDRCNAFASRCRENGIDVALIAWSWINNRDAITTNNVGAGPSIGKCTWVFGDHTTNKWAQLITLPVLEFDVLNKRDVRWHEK